MIKKLKRRFIAITMTGSCLIFVLVLSTINISMMMSSRRQGYRILHGFAKSTQELPNLNPPPDAPDDFVRDSMRIFSVSFDRDGKIMEANLDEEHYLNQDGIPALARTVFNQYAPELSERQGRVDHYLYLSQPQSDGGRRIIFLDYSFEREMADRLLRLCLWIGLPGLLVILGLVIFLSRWVSQPVQMAFDRQKQFIADASHELKTPLAIITTNAEVLKNSGHDSRWLDHIVEQSARMAGLINNLLDLTRLDEARLTLGFGHFNLSKTVESAALSFESIAFETDRQYTVKIADGLSLWGHSDSIRQLTMILLDNAFHYTKSRDEIRLDLAEGSDNKAAKVLTVWNSGGGIPVTEGERIFERFYRYDSSRSRETGGYGLGLAIAKAIVDAHHGQIRMDSDGESYVRFTVLF